MENKIKIGIIGVGNIANKHIEAYQNFVDCILQKTNCIAPAQDGVDIMKILNAIYESAEKKKEILL